MPRVPPVTIATRAIASSLIAVNLCLGSYPRGSIARDTHGDTHAAADAQGRQPLLRVAARHLVEQRHEDSGARGADRMPERDRAAVDVDLPGIPAEILVDRASLRGERLVRLDEVEVVRFPARLLEGGAARRDRTAAHDRGIDAGGRPR